MTHKYDHLSRAELLDIINALECNAAVAAAPILGTLTPKDMADVHQYLQECITQVESTDVGRSN
jgi:hypothetical protein